MALITRCPHCATAFRVTPSHLRPHGGDVRCGQCAQVFDGFATLTTISDLEALDLAKAEAGVENSSRAPGASAATASDQGGSPALKGGALSEQASLPGTPVEKAEDKASRELGVPLEAQGAEPSARETLEAGEPAWGNEGRTIGDKTGNRRGAAASSGLSFRDGDRLEPELGRPMPDEVMETYLSDKYPYHTARPGQTSLGWAIGNLFLLIVLAAQIIYWYRVDLAVIAPATRPFLEQYCKLLECTVSLPAQEHRAYVASEKTDVRPGYFCTGNHDRSFGAGAAMTNIIYFGGGKGGQRQNHDRPFDLLGRHPV